MFIVLPIFCRNIPTFACVKIFNLSEAIIGQDKPSFFNALLDKAIYYRLNGGEKYGNLDVWPWTFLFSYLVSEKSLEVLGN